MLNGGYYADYASLMGTMGLPTMHHSTWDNLVSWVGPHVDRLACEQVRADIEKSGDRSQWMAGFDGFYLTRGHHSNHTLATLHDVYSDRIAWFTHRTKRGKDSNFKGKVSGIYMLSFKTCLIKKIFVQKLKPTIIVIRAAYIKLVAYNHFIKGFRDCLECFNENKCVIFFISHN